MKNKSLPTLNKKLWKIFSEYIRRKDADSSGYNKCFSCGSVKHYKELDSGHYIPKSVSLHLRFDERNVHPQCTACNRFRHGNLTEYAIALQEEYGQEILKTLDEVRHTQTKYNRFDYEGMIENYQQKLASLDVL